MRWTSLGVVAALGVVVVRSGTRHGGDPRMLALPVATTLLGVWLCFLFEDAAAEITAPSPTPLALRRAVRVGLAVPLVTVVWWGLTWVGPLSGPSAPMAEAFVATVLVALAAAAVATRVVGPSRAALPAAAVLVATMLVTPITLAVLLHRPASVDPAHPPLSDPVTYWASVALLAAVILGLAHLDPARAPIRLGRPSGRAARGEEPTVARGAR